MLPGIRQFDLTGRAAIVTGGSKGLGEAMAEGLASAGEYLLITAAMPKNLRRWRSEFAASMDARRSELRRM